MATEMQLDHFFWNAVSSNLEFQSWFLKRANFSDPALALICDEQWHQRWYRDPVTKEESETDILLIFKDLAANRFAIHIENKPPGGKWRLHQPENYRIRAIDRMLKWRYINFKTVLIAPLSFIAKWPVEVAHFDTTIPYEDIGRFVPEFGECLRNTVSE